MIPNLLSLLRLCLGPLLFLELTAAQRLMVVVVAGITDGLDGWLARRLAQTSAVGAVLDPICDKGFSACALISCWQAGTVTVPLLLALLAREFALAVLPLLCAARSMAGYPCVLYVGTCISSKLFTTVQFGAIGAAVFGLTIPVGLTIILWILAAGSLAQWLRASGAKAPQVI